MVLFCFGRSHSVPLPYPCNLHAIVSVECVVRLCVWVRACVKGKPSISPKHKDDRASLSRSSTTFLYQILSKCDIYCVFHFGWATSSASSVNSFGWFDCRRFLFGRAIGNVLLMHPYPFRNVFCCLSEWMHIAHLILKHRTRFPFGLSQFFFPLSSDVNLIHENFSAQKWWTEWERCKQKNDSYCLHCQIASFEWSAKWFRSDKRTNERSVGVFFFVLERFFLLLFLPVWCSSSLIPFGMTMRNTKSEQNHCCCN